MPTDFWAHVELWPPERSARTRPLLPGFRGQIRWSESEDETDILLTAESSELVPGQDGDIGLRFLFADERRTVDIGSRFTLREGATDIATGEVVRFDGRRTTDIPVRAARGGRRDLRP